MISDSMCQCIKLIIFFKQKTAYEMRISDWSSDVCSSDLVRKYRCTQFQGGHAVFDRQHQCLDRIRAFGCHDLAAQQTVVRLVGNQFDETPRIACCQCPWHSIEREQLNLDVQALRPCCRFSEAGAGDLRVGEDDGWHGGIVVAVLVARPRVADRKSVVSGKSVSVSVILGVRRIITTNKQYMMSTNEPMFITCLT